MEEPNNLLRVARMKELLASQSTLQLELFSIEDRRSQLKEALRQNEKARKELFDAVLFPTTPAHPV